MRPARLALLVVQLAGAVAMMSALAQPAAAAPGAWTTTGSLTTAPTRQDFTLTLLDDGRALAAGGETASSQLYNPAGGTWSPTGALSESHRDHAAVRLADGKVLVTGGFGTALPLRSAELHDPSTGLWSSCSGSGTPGASCPGAMTTSRFGHTATLLNNGRVLVIGGNSEGSTAEVYNPATGLFASVSGGTRRTEHEATRLADGRVLITGGTSIATGGAPTTSADLYDPATSTLSPAAPLSTRRAHHTATLLGNDKVLVAGGTSAAGGGPAYMSAELYSPATGTWTDTRAPMKNSRFDHTATPLANGTVLLASGFGRTVEGDERIAASELYDPATDSFARTDSLHEARYEHEAALLQSGKVLVAGGAQGAELFDPAGTLPAPTVSAVEPRRGRATGGTLVVITGTGFRGASEVLFGSQPAALFTVNSETRITARAPAGATGTVHVRVENSGGPSAESPADEFSFVATAPGTWAFTGFMREGRSSHTMTLLQGGRVLAAGSQLDAGPNDSRSSTETYDPLTSTWTLRAPMRFAREEHTATLLDSGAVLVAGGTTGPEGNGTQAPPNGPLAATELYDPGAGTWTSCSSPGTPSPTCPGPLAERRSDHGAALLPGGKVLVAGGHTGAGDGCSTCTFTITPLASAELYNLSTGTWSSCSAMGTPTPTCPAAMGSARDRVTMTALRNGKVLVVGGRAAKSGPSLASAELYDPGTGTWSATGNSLSVGRTEHTATLLSDGRVLVAGGSGAGTSVEIYDPVGDRWSPAGQLLDARRQHTATLLRNGTVMIVGGDGVTNTLTELYDPAADAGRGLSYPGDATSDERAAHEAVLLPSGPAALCGGHCDKLLVAGGPPGGDLMVNPGNRTAELFALPGAGAGPGAGVPGEPAPPQPTAPNRAACAHTKRGTARSERLTGTTLGDRLFGLGGNDMLNGLQGDDCLFGGAGKDALSGSSGNDRLQGDPGGDKLGGGAGKDRLSGGSGNDRLTGDSGNDSIDGGAGNDKLSGVSGDDRLVGGSGRDALSGGRGKDSFSGGSGNDAINSVDRRGETVNCGSGRDVVRADRSDRLRGCERVTRVR